MKRTMKAWGQTCHGSRPPWILWTGKLYDTQSAALSDEFDPDTQRIVRVEITYDDGRRAKAKP